MQIWQGLCLSSEELLEKPHIEQETAKSHLSQVSQLGSLGSIWSCAQTGYQGWAGVWTLTRSELSHLQNFHHKKFSRHGPEGSTMVLNMQNTSFTLNYIQIHQRWWQALLIKITETVISRVEKVAFLITDLFTEIQHISCFI